MLEIETLSAAQQAQMEVYRDKWIAIGLSTAPANRAAAEDGIRRAYAAAGLDAPKIVWCGSPLSQGLTRAIILDKKLIEDLGASVRDSVWDSVWDSVRASVGDSIYGQHDAAWLGFYDFFLQVCALKSQTKKLQGLWALSKSAGWALPHQQICWVSERHNILTRDNQGRLHNLTGPAVAYPDGWMIYAFRGTRISGDWIEKKGSLTPKIALTWGNIEQRRAACEIIGWNRILNELNAQSIDKDADPMIGELLEVEIPDIGREKFLRVMCATGRTFALPVPPQMQTALQANAWTYDMDQFDYRKMEIRT